MCRWPISRIRNMKWSIVGFGAAVLVVLAIWGSVPAQSPEDKKPAPPGEQDRDHPKARGGNRDGKAHPGRPGNPDGRGPRDGQGGPGGPNFPPPPPHPLEAALD